MDGYNKQFLLLKENVILRSRNPWKTRKLRQANSETAQCGVKCDIKCGRTAEASFNTAGLLLGSQLRRKILSGSRIRLLLLLVEYSATTQLKGIQNRKRNPQVSVLYCAIYYCSRQMIHLQQNRIIPRWLPGVRGDCEAILS